MNLKCSDIHYGAQLQTLIITNVLSVIPDTITINTLAIVLSMSRSTCLCLWTKYFLTGGFIILA